MNIGIVGAEAAKFTAAGEASARAIIRSLLVPAEVVAVVSGHCHLGGVDIWAEEIARDLGKLDPALIFPPARKSWMLGYKPRNIAIAENSTVVHNIVVDVLPNDFRGMRWTQCYHCKSTAHVKSGGCWTAKFAERTLGRGAVWHVVRNYPDDRSR